MIHITDVTKLREIKNFKIQFLNSTSHISNTPADDY